MPGIGKQRRPRALELFVAGRSTTEVAADLGVTPQSVHTTLHDAQFAAELADARRERWDSLRGRLDALALEGVDELASLARGWPDNDGAPERDSRGDLVVNPSVRERAWRDLLDRAGVSPTLAVEVRREQGQKETTAGGMDAREYIDYLAVQAPWILLFALFRELPERPNGWWLQALSRLPEEWWPQVQEYRASVFG